jgi:hypothetical protein
MISHRIARGTVVAIAIFVVASATAHASTLTVKVDPPDAGTTQSPQTHTTSITLDKINPGADGNSKVAPVTLVESFPADFAVTLGSYASCSSAKVVHGDKKPDCPDSSILGTASGSAYVPALLFNTTSDYGWIYKLSDHAVRAWIHFSSPQQVGVIINGVFGTGAAPFGPTITWDFKAIGSGAEAGVEVRVNSISYVWNRHAASASSHARAGSEAITRASSSRASSNCTKRARRIKDKRKRKQALRRCAKAKPTPAPAPAPPPASGDYSPLVSTGCAAGSWPFRATMSFTDGTSETADTSVKCSGPPPPPPPPTGGGGPTSPLCPPICAPSARLKLPTPHRTPRPYWRSTARFDPSLVRGPG